MRRDDDEDDDRRPRRRRRREDDEDDDDFDDRIRRIRKEDSDDDIGDDPAMRLILPVGLSGWAIASGYLGLISVLLFPAPFALLTGVLAIREMQRNPKKHGMGRAIFGIIMGGLGTLVALIVAVALLLAWLK
jgi:hypothetical protein